MKLEVVTLNVCGLQSPGRYLRFVCAAKRWAKMGKAHVVCIQSHNLNPAKQEEHERLAQECGFTLKIGYAPAGRAPVGEAPVHYGGTAILVYETLKTIREPSAPPRTRPTRRKSCATALSSVTRRDPRFQKRECQEQLL